MAAIVEPEPLTSHVRPYTDAVITVRVIKSFPYHNIRNHVLTLVNLKTMTPSELLKEMKDIISTQGAFRPYRNVKYDTLKIYTKAHGTKSMDLAINFDHDDDWILVSESEEHSVPDNSKSLFEFGVENETEISLFHWSDYVLYKQHPVEKW